MGTRSSKHNRGRKPEYKDHNAVEVFEEKREPEANFVDDETPELGNDLPELQPLTFGGIDEDLQNRVRFAPVEVIAPPTDNLGISIHKRSAFKGRKARGNFHTWEIKKPLTTLRKLASADKREALSKISPKQRKKLRELLGDFHWDKIGRVHYLLNMLKCANRHSLPSSFHELDPLEIMVMAEDMDLWKATTLRLPHLLGKIRG